MSLIWGSVTLYLYLWLTKIPNDKYAVLHCLPIRTEYLVIFHWGRLQTLSGRPGGLKKAVGYHNLCGRTKPVAIHSLVGRAPTNLVSWEARNVTKITEVRGHTFNQPPKIFCDNLFPCSWEARNVTKITEVRGHTFLQSTSKKNLWQPISVQLGTTKRDRNHGGSRPYLN